MNDRFQLIESKLDGIGQMIEGLACFGNRKSSIDAEQLKSLVKEVNALKGGIEKAASLLPRELKPLNNVEEVARYLRRTEGTVREKIRSGELKASRIDSTREDDKAPYSMTKEDVLDYERRSRGPGGSGKDPA